METDIYRLNSHPLRIRAPCWGGLAIRKKIAGKCRRPFSDPPGDLIDRWEHRDGRGRAPRANGSDIPFSAIPPDLRRGKGVNPFPTLFWLARRGTCEAQTEACMALPGPAKGLAVATVTYINYPSRRKPKFRRAPGCGLRFCPPRGFSEYREALREVHDVDRVRDG